MEAGNKVIESRLAADIAALAPCPACAPLPDKLRTAGNIEGAGVAAGHSLPAHHARLAAHQQALDSLIVRLPGQASDLAQLKRLCDAAVQRLDAHVRRCADEQRRVAMEKLTPHVLDCRTTLERGLQREMGVARAQQKRAAAVQHWARARRLLRVQSACDYEASEALRQQQRHKMHVELLRRLTAGRAADVDLLVVELSAVRERLETVTAAEDRFIARQQYEDLRARLAELQRETAALTAATAAAQERAAGLRAALATLACEQPDRAAESLQARAARALEAAAHFERLFGAGEYGPAAVAAAASPEGSLRTPQVWARFRAATALAPTAAAAQRWSRRALARGRAPQEPSGRLAGGALLTLAAAIAAAQPSAAESLACVECAIEFQQWDLIAHWLAQEMLQSSAALADMLARQCGCAPGLHCRCRAAALALAARDQAGDRAGAVHALLRQGHTALAFVRAGRAGWTPARLLPLVLAVGHVDQLLLLARALFLVPPSARPAVDDASVLAWAARHLTGVPPLYPLPAGADDVALLAACMAQASLEWALLDGDESSVEGHSDS